MEEEVVKNTPIEENAPQTEEQQPKMKKKSLFSRIFIPLLVIFVIVPSCLIGLTYALFYDPTHTNIPVREYYPTEEVINDVLVHSLDNTVADKEMRIRLTEDAINQVFHNVIEEAGSSVQGVNNFYVRITKNQYVFVFELDFNGWFQTRAFFYTHLKVTSEKVIFQIDNVKVGRVGKLNYMTKVFAAGDKLPDVSKILRDHGFHMTFDLYNLAFIYPIDKLVEDLGSHSGGGTSEYLILLKEMLLNHNFVELYPYKEKAIEADLSLYNMRPDETLYNIEGYQMPQGYLNFIMANAVTKTKNYLEANTITSNDAEAVFNYYVQGYDHLSSMQKDKVNPYLGVISDATDTYNYSIPDDEHLDNIVTDQLSAYFPGDSHIEASITTNQVDRALSEADNIGQSTLFKAKSEAYEFTCNYVTFDRFTSIVDSVNQSLFLTVSVNFNGYDIGITLKTTLSSDSSYGVAKFHIDGFYLGNDMMSNDAFDQFVSLLSSAVSSESFGGTISIVDEGDEKFLVFDIKDMLNGAGITEAEGYSTTFQVLNQTATTPGTLKFVAEK